MFTGIIEEKGIVRTIHKQGASMALTLEANRVLTDIKVGDSIAVNGVCLTVTRFNSASFTVDVMPETFRDTSLRLLTKGSLVNLERALAANGRFGGHFVSGHIDQTGIIKSTWQEANAHYIRIVTGQADLSYLVNKGSITVDGTSLTISNVKADGFIVSLIPETQRATILADKQQGDLVNLEFDLLAKYIEKMLVKQKQANQVLTKETLLQSGFPS